MCVSLEVEGGGCLELHRVKVVRTETRTFDRGRTASCLETKNDG